MSNVEVKGKGWVRPYFVYAGDISYDDVKAQLLESIRNTLEQIRDKQMLQCDVRSDLRAMRKSLLAIQQQTKKRKYTRRTK